MKKENKVKVLGLFERANKSDRAMTSGLLRFCERHTRWEIRLMDPDAAGFTRDVKLLCASWEPDGIVSCSGGFRGFSSAAFRKSDPVRIAIDPPTPRLGGIEGAVLIDDDAIARSAVRLFRDRRLGNLAYIGTNRTSEASHSLNRERAFAKYAGTANAVESFTPSDTRFDGWLDELPLMAEWLASLPKPCGILSYCDARAVQVLDACRIAHLNVPEQIALVGVDNDAGLCGNLQPSLTSIMPDFEGAGYLAGKILQAILDTGRRPRTTLTRRYGVKAIVERESTCDLRGGGRLVNAARAYIASNACAGAGVEETARALNVSRRLLELRFAEIAGHTVREEIADVRLGNVCRLLRETSRTVSDIAWSSGYGTVAALMTAFRKRFGTTPGGWRARRA